MQYKRKSLQKLLNACRNLRIPYLIYRDDFEILKMDKVLVPVNFLEEEIEKAQFASAFGQCFARIRSRRFDFRTKGITFNPKNQHSGFVGKSAWRPLCFV
jgi:hypothetical protein